MIVVDCGFRCRFLSAARFACSHDYVMRISFSFWIFPQWLGQKKIIHLPSVDGCRKCGTYQFFFGFLLKVDKNHMCHMGFFIAKAEVKEKDKQARLLLELAVDLLQNLESTKVSSPNFEDIYLVLPCAFD